MATYDYGRGTGNGPASPLTIGAEYRLTRDNHLVIFVLVDLDEVAELLPAGFRPVAAESVDALTTLNLVFGRSQISETLDEAGQVETRVGPSNVFLVFARVFDSSGEQGTMLLGAYASDAATVAAINSQFAGTGQIAEQGRIDFAVTQTGNSVGVKCRIVPLAVRIEATMTGAYALEIRDPFPGVIASRNGPAFRAALGAEFLRDRFPGMSVVMSRGGDRRSFRTQPGGRFLQRWDPIWDVPTRAAIVRRNSKRFEVKLANHGFEIRALAPSLVIARNLEGYNRLIAI